MAVPIALTSVTGAVFAFALSPEEEDKEEEEVLPVTAPICSFCRPGRSPGLSSFACSVASDHPKSVGATSFDGRFSTGTKKSDTSLSKRSRKAGLYNPMIGKPAAAASKTLVTSTLIPSRGVVTRAEAAR